MTSLSWKRKSKTNVQNQSASFFTDGDDNDDANGEVEVEADWTKLLPKKKALFEDGGSASGRLMEEGIFLAEQQRYWEAINRFDEALAYERNEAKLYEMKAQALLELSELDPAVEAAEKAVKLDPLWAEAYQTLGRTQISYGKIEMALRSFCIALHLKPDFQEVYQEDLSWALDLRKRKKNLETSEVPEEKPPHPVSCCCSSHKVIEQNVEEPVKLNIMEPS